MKTRIAFGCALLLMLGTAAAGTWIYGRADSSESMHEAPSTATGSKNSAAALQMWRATAVSADYVAPKVPS